MPLALLFALLLAPADRPAQLISACDDPAEWRGGTLDTGLKRAGSGSIRWEHATCERLELVSPPKDWSERTALRFRLHSAVATGSTFMLIVGSENPASEGADYWMAPITLDFTGWREVTLPLRTLTAARQPLGWDQVTGLFLAAGGWDHTPDPRAVVHLDQVELTDMVGPRLTDEELLAAFDLDLAELAPVKAKGAAGDLPGAKRALAAYLRARTSVPWWFDPHQVERAKRPETAGAADQVLAGEVTVVTVNHTFPSVEFDWFYNPTIERADLPDNHEWQWQLGRMHFWDTLARAYWGTGDERYAEGFVRQLRSWVRSCPMPEKVANGAGSAWRTIECGIRLRGSWPNAYQRFLTSPSFTDDDLLLYLKSVVEQSRYLRAHQTTGNWLTMEMSGLYTSGAMFPELREAAEWRSFAARRLYDDIRTQFLADGAQIELTPGYHQVALDNVLAIPRVAELVGRLDELPADYVARAEKAFDFNLELMTPDRSLPRFNDSWEVNVPGSLGQAFKLYPHRADYQWVATDGREGSPPAGGSRALPWAGYFVMRSSWDRLANYAVLDAGPLGYGHYHQDKLNLVVWAYGRELLFDDGGASYERSPQRSYSTDTFAHNTVLVDGRPQRRPTRDRNALVAKAPIEARWESTEAHDFAAGSYDDGYGTEEQRLARHTRRVLYVKPDLFIVADTLQPLDGQPHRYEARWHLRPTATVTDQATGMVATAEPGQPNLAVVPLLAEGLTVRSASAQREPLLGWYCQKDRQPAYLPATTVLHQRGGEGAQQFVTLLLPLKPGEASPIASVATTGTATEVRLSDHRRWRIEASTEPGGPITFRETLANGAPGRQVTGG